MYFWRTKHQQEVDLVEESGGKISGFEFKWNDKQAHKNIKTFCEAYSTGIELVNRKNFREFLS